MGEHERDRSLDTLLDLDGEVMVIDPTGKHWVKFFVTRVPPSPEKPHGLDYSLTLHDENDNRLVSFDNAHPVRASSRPGDRAMVHDHKHRLRTIRPYDYKDAVTLLKVFRAEVDAVLKERGVL